LREQLKGERFLVLMVLEGSFCHFSHRQNITLAEVCGGGTLPRCGQEAEKGAGRGQRQDPPQEIPPMTWFLQLRSHLKFPETQLGTKCSSQEAVGTFHIQTITVGLYEPEHKLPNISVGLIT
jgi:hypothetical protein